MAATIKDVVVSPDGRYVYVSSAPSDPPDPPFVTGGSAGVQAVAVLTRRADGTLGQRRGRAGCVANRRLDGCAIRRTLRATEIAVSPDGRHVYLAGSATLTVMERNERTGMLTWRSCLASGSVGGCSPLPPGVRCPDVPAFSPDGRSAYLATPRYDCRRTPSPISLPWSALLISLTRDPVSGALAARPAPAGCLSATPFRDCTVDARLDEGVSTPVFAPGGRDAYATTGPFSYDVPLDPGVPFAITGFRHDPATGTLTAADAPCLSRLDRAGCTREPRVARIGDLSLSPDGTWLYAIRGQDIATFARDTSTGSLRLVDVLRGCPDFGRCRAEAPIDGPAEIQVSLNGRYLYVVSNSDYGSGTVTSIRTP